ncbi:MAG TPA: TIGR02281 family clan AA aspartic protease [Croceibacterium sp.]|nr:TIGR02281 family clan AA aspartic protease [Croceibacterium sp.]
MQVRPFIAIVIATGALIGWLAPGAPDAPASAGAAGPGESANRLEVVQREQWLAGEVVLPRESDGHFYADVAVDGATTRMLVDTGASVVALTGADADALGIEWDPDAVRPVAQGASGAVYGVDVTIERMQLGSLEAQAVEAIVVPDGLGTSLLGQSFLGQIQRVEIGHDQMVLGG